MARYIVPKVYYQQTLDSSTAIEIEKYRSLSWESRCNNDSAFSMDISIDSISFEPKLNSYIRVQDRAEIMQIEKREKKYDNGSIHWVISGRPKQLDDEIVVDAQNENYFARYEYDTLTNIETEKVYHLANSHSVVIGSADFTESTYYEDNVGGYYDLEKEGYTWGSAVYSQPQPIINKNGVELIARSFTVWSNLLYITPGMYTSGGGWKDGVYVNFSTYTGYYPPTLSTRYSTWNPDYIYYDNPNSADPVIQNAYNYMMSKQTYNWDLRPNQQTAVYMVSPSTDVINEYTAAIVEYIGQASGDGGYVEVIQSEQSWIKEITEGSPVAVSTIVQESGPTGTTRRTTIDQSFIKKTIHTYSQYEMAALLKAMGRQGTEEAVYKFIAAGHEGFTFNLKTIGEVNTRYNVDYKIGDTVTFNDLRLGIRYTNVVSGAVETVDSSGYNIALELGTNSPTLKRRIDGTAG